MYLKTRHSVSCGAEHVCLFFFLKKSDIHYVCHWQQLITVFILFTDFMEPKAAVCVITKTLPPNVLWDVRQANGELSGRQSASTGGGIFRGRDLFIRQMHGDGNVLGMTNEMLDCVRVFFNTNVFQRESKCATANVAQRLKQEFYPHSSAF